METLLTYRHRKITRADIVFLNQLITDNPGVSRRALSFMVCEAWNWKQDNGACRDAVCRGLMLKLHRAAYLELPPARWTALNKPKRQRIRAAVEVDEAPIKMNLKSLGPLSFRQVRRTDDEALLEGLIKAHHYLGYTRPVGEHLKFLVRAGDRPVACFVWSSAARHLGPRDRYIGWDAAARLRNIRFIAYNGRFLILPWVEVNNLASHLLGRMTRMLPAEWERVYGHPVHLAETFVDTARFRGTCYRAANWSAVGQTTGRGKDDQTKRANRSLKEVFVLPLHQRYQSLLVEET